MLGNVLVYWGGLYVCEGDWVRVCAISNDHEPDHERGVWELKFKAAVFEDEGA